MQTTADKIEEQLRVKRLARKELRSIKHSLNEQAGKKVVDAFKDVFQALRLAAMDISNSLRLAIGVLITFDPQKIDKKIEAFDTRRQNINAEWKPILQRAQEAISSADPILTMAIMGPANFLAVQGLGVGLTAGKTVAEVIAAKNWDTIIDKWDVKIDVNQSVQQFFQKWDKRETEREDREFEAGVSSGNVPKGKGMLSRLSNLFSESVNASPILEQKSQQELPSSNDQPKISEKDAINMLIKATGMDVKFKELLDNQKKNLKDTIPPILEDLQPMVAVSNMFAATDIDSFNKSVAQAKSVNPKLKDEPFKKFTDQVQSETQKILNDPKASADAKKNLGAGKELSPEELQKAVGASVFGTLKSEFDKETAKTIKTARDSAKSAIDNLKIDEKTMKKMDESPDPEVKEISQIYKKLLKTYDTINSDFESKAKSRMA